MRLTFRLALLLGIGVLAMSSASILIRWALAAGAPPLVVAAYRLMTATLALSIPAGYQRAWMDYVTLGRRQVTVLVLSGILLALHFAAWITSFSHTSVVSSVVLVTTTPLWIGLAGPLFLHERTPRATWIGIAVAIVGGAIIGSADLRAEATLAARGDLLALAGAIFGAGYLLIGRSVRSSLSLLGYLWLVYGVAGLVLTGWALLTRVPLIGYPAAAVLSMVALGLVPQLIGHSTANYALRHLPASLVGVTILGEPVGSSVLAIALLNEWPSPLQLLGGLVILGGIACAAIPLRPIPNESTLGPAEL